MPTESNISAIAHVIQLAIAPVFLLSGVATLLGVLTNRLGRIIDRARVLEAHFEQTPERRREDSLEELKRLSSRARLINLAINLCTVCALLICLVIATLFSGTFLPVNLSRAVAVIFIASMLSLFLGLLSFLREIVIATRAFRINTTADPRNKSASKNRASFVRE